MEEEPTARPDAEPATPMESYAGLVKAPEHVVDMLLGALRPYSGPPGAAGYAKAARADARRYADRIWAEAVHAGAVWGMARSSQTRIELSGELVAGIAAALRKPDADRPLPGGHSTRGNGSGVYWPAGPAHRRHANLRPPSPQHARRGETTLADTAAPISPDRPCRHEAFFVQADVGRIGEEDPGADGMPRAYMLDISVKCDDPPNGCGEPFRFTGVQAGMSFQHPMCSPDETMLRAPIRPASADPDFGMGIPGFSIGVVRP